MISFGGSYSPNQFLTPAISIVSDDGDWIFALHFLWWGAMIIFNR